MGDEMTTAHSGSGDIQRGLELLWGMREAPTRRPKRGLTLERIVEAAVTVADAEGLAAVSMRRVATDLGVGTMSLYRYVPGKSELLELMLDHVQEVGEENAAAQRALPWRELLLRLGHSIWDLYLRHPWLLQVNQARPLLGPNAMAGMDLSMGGLENLGMTDQERLSVIVTIESYVAGSARNHVNALEAARHTGVSDEEFWAAQGPFLAEAMQGGGFPTLARLGEDTFDVGGDTLFEFGLVRLVDGIAAFIEAKIEASTAGRGSGRD